MWKSTAGAFRICMGHIVFDDFMPSYGPPKLTLVSIFFYMNYTVIKNPTATIFEWEVPQRIASFETHFFRTLFVCGALTRKLWPWDFLLRFPIFAGRSRFAALSRLRTGITRTKIFFTYLSYRYSESWVRGESVGAGPRKVSICKFGATDRFIKKHRFSLISASPPPSTKYRPAVNSILMPPCFHIAHLKRYVPNFSGVPQKLTWRNRFGLQLPPKWHDLNRVAPKQAIFRPFFVENNFFRPNGPLSPYTCYTYSESLACWPSN